ncbi:MAG: hypothetical protein M3R54_07280 [Chloroflexota bacterium]|nr:hypothetical protein [Chloroflexota bacterium]
MHFTGSLDTPVGAFTTKGDVIADRRTAGSLRGCAICTPIRSPLRCLRCLRSLEQSIGELTSGFPMVVRQVAMRQGCLAVIGTT